MHAKKWKIISSQHVEEDNKWETQINEWRCVAHNAVHSVKQFIHTHTHIMTLTMSLSALFLNSPRATSLVSTLTLVFISASRDSSASWRASLRRDISSEKASILDCCCRSYSSWFWDWGEYGKAMVLKVTSRNCNPEITIWSSFNVKLLNLLSIWWQY